MVDSNQLFPPHQRQGTSGNGDTLQRGAHARALGVADAVQVGDSHPGLAHGLLDQAHHPGAVMYSDILGQEAFARRRIVRVAQISQHNGLLSGGRVRDDAHAELVGTAFEAKGNHGWWVCTW